MNFNFFCIAAISLSASVLAAPPANFSGWDLVFEDEFDGTSLDKSKWNPTYNWGHTHNHRAYCVEENVIVKDGKLMLKGEAKKHPDAPATAKFNGSDVPVDYTSGAIDTRGKFEVKYGYIEGRFKAPWQAGTWPAFWTLQDGWPPEIDILEIPASRKQHHYYLHYTNPSWYSEHGSAWDHEASFGGTSEGPDKSADFHNYGVEWNENNLIFYFDDKKIASYNRPTEIRQLDAQYIIINLAIGAWAGDNIEVTAETPAYFEAEWVRVWKQKPVKPDTVRVKSVAFGKCMQSDANKKLILGDCENEAASVEMVPVSSGVYRFNFGDVSLEIPNEKTDPGVIAGLYTWNGGAHQKVNVELQDGNEVRLKMNHSGHYLRATEDGANVVQDWSTAWEWHQKWEIVRGEDPKPEEPQEPETPESLYKYVAPTSKGKAQNLVFRQNGMLYVESGTHSNGEAKHYNLKGSLLQ